MAIFRRIVCTRKNCHYWRPRLFPLRYKPQKGEKPAPCPRCGSPVRQAENYTIQWYNAPGDKRTETLGTSHKEAKAALAEKISQRKTAPTFSEGGSVPSAPPQKSIEADLPTGSIPFDRLAREFQKIHAAEIKDTVREDVVIRHLIEFFGSRPLKDILQKDVRSYRGYRQNQTVLHGKVERKKNGEPFDRKKPARKVSAATVGRELAVLKLILKYANTNKYIRYDRPEDHPFYEVEIPVSREVHPRWTLEDLERLFALLSPGLAIFFRFVAETGCRMEEAMALTWFRVVPGKSIAYLRDTKTAEAEGGEEILHLSPEALALIQAQPEECDYVFFNPRTKTRWKSPAASFRRAAAKAGFFYEDGKLIRPHDLRHILLTALANSGTNDRTLMEISRHTDVRSIRRYIQVRNHSVQQAFAQMERT